MAFALELYNLSSTWHDDRHTAGQVSEFMAAVIEASKNMTAYTGSKHDLDNLKTGKSKKRKTNATGGTGGGAGGGADGGAAGADGGAAGGGAAGGGAADEADDGADSAADKAARSAAGQLEHSGYEVVPDVFEVNGDVWDLIDKVHMEIFLSPSLTSH